MAVTTQDSSEMPDDDAHKPPDLAAHSTKSSKIPFNRISALNPVVKRRRLNDSTPASGSKGSASRWFDNLNHNVKPCARSTSDFDRAHIPSIQWP
jgi:hypothetical protein